MEWAMVITSVCQSLLLSTLSQSDVKNQFDDFLCGKRRRIFIDVDRLQRQYPVVYNKFDDCVHFFLFCSILFDAVEGMNKLRRELFQELRNYFQQNSTPADEFPLKGDLNIGFIGTFGKTRVSPRGLVSTLNCTMVMVEGIVTKSFFQFYILNVLDFFQFLCLTRKLQ